MEVGDTVRSTGQGKTSSWGNYIGVITKIESDKIYVRWNETSFEDEMSMEEIEPFNISEIVSKLHFSDGMIIHTQGPLRVVEFYDGFYVVGEGKLIPVKDEKEGEDLVGKIIP